MHKHATQGGCWFCSEDDMRPMHFSLEFDTYFHMECLHNELNSHPGSVNPEAEIIANEFDIETPSDLCYLAQAWDEQFWLTMLAFASLAVSVGLMTKVAKVLLNG